MSNKAMFHSQSVPVQELPSIIGNEVFNNVLLIAADSGASDVIFRSSTEARARVSGFLTKITDSEFEVEDIYTFIKACETEQTAISLSSGTPKSFAYNLIRPEANAKPQRFRMSAASVNDKRSEYGVRLVCRPIQDRPYPLDDMDLPQELKDALATPNNKGIILITGETGSGKTTLLASTLDKKARMSGINIATLEDPIEYNLTYLNDETDSIVAQAALGPHLKDFALGLRGLLRDNPDVILVGEMRDIETIKLGITASRTGHLVYSTLHVTNVAAIIDRMCIQFDGGEQIETAASLIDSLRCGVNQELLPKLCECATPLESLNPILAEASVELKQAHKPVGCDKCNGTGYSGRQPVIEYLVLTNDTRTELKKTLITKGLGGVSIHLQDLVQEHGQTKMKSAQEAFQKGLISEESFVSIFMEYQTLEYLKRAAEQS